MGDLHCGELRRERSIDNLWSSWDYYICICILRIFELKHILFLGRKFCLFLASMHPMTTSRNNELKFKSSGCKSPRVQMCEISSLKLPPSEKECKWAWLVVENCRRRRRVKKIIRISEYLQGRRRQIFYNPFLVRLLFVDWNYVVLTRIYDLITFAFPPSSLFILPAKKNGKLWIRIKYLFLLTRGYPLLNRTSSSASVTFFLTARNARIEFPDVI